MSSRLNIWFFFPLTLCETVWAPLRLEGDVKNPLGLLGCACVTAALRAPNNKFSIKRRVGNRPAMSTWVTPRENSQLECYRAALCCPCSCCRCRPGPVPCSRWALPVHDQFRGQGDQQTGIRTAWNSQVRDTAVLAVLHNCWSPKVPVLGNLSQVLWVARLEDMGIGRRWSPRSLPTHTSLWFHDTVNLH